MNKEKELMNRDEETVKGKGRGEMGKRKKKIRS